MFPNFNFASLQFRLQVVFRFNPLEKCDKSAENTLLTLSGVKKLEDVCLCMKLFFKEDGERQSERERVLASLP